MSENFVFVFGKYKCFRCSAISKRSKSRCNGYAANGKAVCRMHGAYSTGPTTREGLEKLAHLKTVHGKETRSIRKKRSTLKTKLLSAIAIGEALGMFNK